MLTSSIGGEVVELHFCGDMGAGRFYVVEFFVDRNEYSQW